MSKVVRSTLFLLFLFLQNSFCQEEINPKGLLENRTKMNDSLLYETYKKIHRHYISFAPDSAILYNQMALKDAENRGNSWLIASICENLVVCHVHIGDYGNAQLYATRGLSLYDDINDVKGQAYLSNSMGIIFGANGDYAKSMEYYNKAIELNKKANDWLKVGINLGNLSGIYLGREEFDKAKSSIEEALSIYIQNKDTLLQSTALNNMGEVYLKMGISDSALSYLQSAKALKKKLGLINRLPVTYNLLGDTYLVMGRLDSVQENYSRAYHISDSLGMSFEARMSLYGLYEYYKALGNDTKALKYHEEYQVLYDSIYNVQKDRQIKELEIRYQVNKKNHEIEELNFEITAQRRLRNLGLVILVLAIALFVLTYMRIRLRSQLLEKENELEKEKSKQLKFEVAEKNRELMSHSMLSIQKNQILNDLKERLLAIQDRDKSILQAIKLVEENHSADNEWENLKIHFEKVHSGFFKKLQDQFPQITSTDLRHCAYIRIQMSSKDVARIMNVDPKSVKMSRYRLKKKFNLEEDDNLEAFLNKI